MLEPNQITDIIDGIIELNKSNKPANAKYAVAKILGKKDTQPEPPEYYAGYNTFRKWREDIAIHSVKGVVPERMLRIKAPNQTQQEIEFAIDNYKQITLPVPEEFLNTIGRGLHSSNWSIQYKEDESRYITAEATFQDYLETGMTETPLQMSFEAWFKYVLPAIKLNDSMGVIAIKPTRPETVVENGNGERVIAGDVLPEPIPYYYPVDQVLSGVDDPYVLVDTGEKSLVMYGNKEQRIGFIYELYDDTFIYRIEQVGKYSDDEYEVYIYFRHDLGFVPASRLKGRPVYVDGKLCWMSPLLLVTDILDEAILDNTGLRNIKASTSYPQRVMIGNPCQFKEEHDGAWHPCENGYILNPGNTGFHKCPGCNGVGFDTRSSVLNTIYVRPKSSLSGDDGDGIKPSEALAYVSASTADAELHRKEVTDHMFRAKEVLHIKTTNSVVQGGEDMTATGMVMDEKAKYAFLSPVVDQIFDLGEFAAYCEGRMRYGESFQPPTWQRPVSYDFNSEADYMNMIAAAQNSGAPPVVIHSYLTKYLRAVYYDDATAADMYDLLIAADRLLPLSSAEIQNRLSRNLIEGWEVVLHDSALTLIQTLLRNDPAFMEQDMETKITALVAEAKRITPAKPAVNAALSILERANAQVA